MMFYGHNRKIMSTLSCYELTELGNIKIKTPCEMALETDREIMNLFEEMFGGEEEIPYTTASTCSSFFPFN